jgi:hypothetical protein
VLFFLSLKRLESPSLPSCSCESLLETSFAALFVCLSLWGFLVQVSLESGENSSRRRRRSLVSNFRTLGQTVLFVFGFVVVGCE